MASSQLTPEQEDEELSKLIDSVTDQASISELSQPNPQSVGAILKERKNQRWVVFCFSIGSAIVSLIALFVIIGVQSYMRIARDGNFTLLSGVELEVLSVSIFGQIIGVIYIIAKSIWDDSIFKDFYKDDSNR